MATLKMQRGSIRAKMSKMTKEILEELKKEPREDLRCHQLFRRIEENNKKINVLNDKIMEMLLVKADATQDDFDSEENGVGEYEAKFLDVQVFYESFYSKPEPVVIPHEQPVDRVPNEGVIDVKKTKYRLPKLELTKFGGDPKDWLRFWSQFASIHEDKSIQAVEKYQYLLQSMSLGSRARDVVESFPPSAENYEKAVEYLRERFGKEDVLVEVYVRELMRLVLDKKNVKISSLYDRLETQLRALETLKVTQEKYAAMLYPLVESCLPEETLRTWERQRHLNGEVGEEGVLGKLMKFLRGEVDGEERVLLARGFSGNSSSKERDKKFQERNVEEATTTATDLYSGTSEKYVKCCLFCEKRHETTDCFIAAKMTLEKRKKILKERRACFVCLQKGHFANMCEEIVVCGGCGQKHQTMMCPGKNEDDEVKNCQESAIVNLSSHSTERILLQTLVVILKGPDEDKRVRALLDTGSQRSYVSKKAAEVLKLPTCGEVNLSHTVFGGTKTAMKSHRMYEVAVESMDSTNKIKLDVLEQEVICGPIARGSSGSWKVELMQKGVELSDVGEGCPEIHLLIGADFAGQLFTGRMVKTRAGPVAMETSLGWTVMGEAGMYQTYQEIIDTWEAYGVVERVEAGGSDLDGSYIPHHAVYKPSSLTTPVRPVFNASAKEGGKAAVNECLEKGPNLIELIPDIMTRYRMKRYGVVSDIKKAFLQISIREEDRNYLRFLWWDKTGKVVQEYRHCRVVFGLTCSPYLLAATLNFHLEKYAGSEKVLVKLILISLYIDNVVTSLNSSEEIATFVKKSVKIMQEAKMELRCWVWTGKEANGDREYENVLGMLWNPIKDTLKLDLSNVCDSTKEDEEDCRKEEVRVGLLSSSDCGLTFSRQMIVTKRQILSAAHRVFDSIGFSAPVSIIPKILLQEVFAKKLSWDEPVGEEIRKKFYKWKAELSFLAEVEVPRWLTGEDFDKLDLSLHVFSDASLSAYAGSPWYNQRFSSWKKAVRVTAYVLRWKQKFSLQKTSIQEIEDAEKTIWERVRKISVEEVEKAEKTLWKSVQKINFSDKAQVLRQFNAEKGEDGIWRVRTKLLLREDSEDFRLPILIPSTDELVQVFLKDLHERNSHCGTQVMLSMVREKFWLLKGRQAVRKIISKCLVCRRFDASAATTTEAPLPSERVSDIAVFEVIGVDLGGPLYLKEKQKSWFVLFTCATYRAVHLELVTSLSTEGFLQAMRRFIGRRGRPGTVFCDNGTNFEGARNALEEVDWNQIEDFAVENRIQWKFSPPAAPWWGGFWERLVGSTKKILRRVLGRASLSYEELLTVLIDAEEIINSRPLTYCTEDVEDLISLTPNMFLREIQSGETMDLDTVDSKSLNRRLRYRQKLREDLRSRFRSEYLGLLVHRMKTSPKKSVLKVGALVLVHNDLKKRMEWPLGKVEQLFPGKDGIERVARVRTSTGVYLRPVKKLIPLEVSEEDGNLLKEMEKETGVGDYEQQKEKNSGVGDLQKEKETGDGVVTRSGRRLKLPVSSQVS